MRVLLFSPCRIIDGEQTNQASDQLIRFSLLHSVVDFQINTHPRVRLGWNLVRESKSLVDIVRLILCVSVFSCVLETCVIVILEVGDKQPRPNRNSGFVLGPLMFIVYITFILLKIRDKISCEIVAYADDTSFLFDMNPASLT